MRDEEKTKQQLIAELLELRRQLAGFEAADPGGGKAHTEEKLPNSERTLRTLVDASPESILLVSAKGTILLANETTAQRLGRPADEIVGSTAYDVLPADIAAVRSEQIAKVVATGQPVRFSDVRFGRHVENVIYPIVDEHGTVAMVAILGIDQTEHKLAEKALQEVHDELEQKVKQRAAELDIFHKFAESAGRGYGMADMEGRITYANPMLCRLFGEEKPEDVIGKHVSVYYPEQYKQRREHEIIPALLREGSWQGEQVVHSRQGTLIPTLQNSFLIRDEWGEPYRFGVAIADISEQKRAQEALRRSEERFDLAVRGVGVGIWDYDILAGKVFYSPRWKAMFGYSEDEIGDGLADWARLLHPDEHDWIIKLQDDFLASTDMHITAEYRLRHQDGCYRWIEAHGVVVRNDEGKAIRFVGSHGDITARKDAEEALRASEARFRSYFEQGMMGMAVTSVEGRWVEVNDRLCQILGHSREELAAKTWKELTYAEDLSKDLSQFHRLLAGEIDHYALDKRFVHKDGSIVETTIFIRALRKNDGSIDHIVGLLEDITDRKRAEEALRHSYEQLRAIYDGMVDGLTIEDIETRCIVRANAALCRMLGVTAEELPNLRLEDVHPQQSLPMIMEEYSAHAEGRASRSEAVPFLDRQGKLFYADITSSRIVHDGRPSLICFIHDITARKKAEDALERERQTLWTMLQASDHERQVISYDIHDGLAQYLAGAGMQFQCHEALREKSPAEAQKAYDTGVELVHRAHVEARRLISEVRPPVIDEIGLETAILHLVHEHRRRGAPEVDFHSNVQFGRLASILENGLYRIAQEALANACKHSRSKRVTVSLTQEGQEACLKVQDWGIGFDPEAVVKGHFGLEGIRQRVRLLGGRLTIQSEPGLGTVIQVTIPILEKRIEG